MCPGRFLADQTVWLAVARILAVFDISQAKDARGHLIDPEIKFVTGIARYVQFPIQVKERPISPRWPRCSHPEPFKCDIRCRSPARAELVKESFRTEAAEILIPFEHNLASEDKEWLESVRYHDD